MFDSFSENYSAATANQRLWAVITGCGKVNRCVQARHLPVDKITSGEITQF
jgi:hypothetical protein